MKSESRAIIKITVEARDYTMGGDGNFNLVLDDQDKVKRSKAYIHLPVSSVPLRDVYIALHKGQW